MIRGRAGCVEGAGAVMDGEAFLEFLFKLELARSGIAGAGDQSGAEAFYFDALPWLPVTCSPGLGRVRGPGCPCSAPWGPMVTGAPA